MIPAPVISNLEFYCIDIDEDGNCSMIQENGDMKEDVSLPKATHLKELEKQARDILSAGKKELLVRVQKWGDREQMIAAREGKDL